ncbi:hypothetical protein, partial [Paenibacillus sp. SAF-068]|uniref:hypothetical protein n=1 Tax=Paenibacillus sp. SAF-068 TaxID=3436864 RepID=UPI003F81B015
MKRTGKTWCTADVRGWQCLGALLSSDFFDHRSWRLKSDAKLTPAAPSSPSLLVHPQPRSSLFSRLLG